MEPQLGDVEGVLSIEVARLDSLRQGRGYGFVGQDEMAIGLLHRDSVVAAEGDHFVQGHQVDDLVQHAGRLYLERRLTAMKG